MGEVITTDPCRHVNDNWSYGKICVKTKIMEVIMESIDVKIQDNSFSIRVKEIENFESIQLDKVGDRKTLELTVRGQGTEEEEDRGSEDDSLFLDSDEEGSEFSSDEVVEESLGVQEKEAPNPDVNMNESNHECPSGNNDQTVDVNDLERKNKKLEENPKFNLNSDGQLGLRDVGLEDPINQNGVSLKETSPRLKISPLEDSGRKDHEIMKKAVGSGPNTLGEVGLDKAMKTPTVLDGVSDKMKILISRSTPIKEKLVIINGNVEDQKVNQTDMAEDKTSECNFSTCERRITRSQTSRSKNVEVRKTKAGRKESMGESLASVGVSNRLEEIGDTCGF
ncbi:hypothetical protein L2E82_03926 [Cichorium intybus]|uniref:Uncharacterized protein n=1 Tax=Cichorium intybus TaxID=13427 RepID=A0ACB9H4N2_CICIN|nr:hypothetical protein L2E82_03926 [Cichorium intybus]